MKPLRVFSSRAAQRGFSLIELMVSVTIGLIVTLAVTGVLFASEQRRRSSTSVNDISQTGAYLSYVLDKSIRAAGSGFSQRTAGALGCLLNVSRRGNVVLPSPGAFPAPFGGVTTNLRLAPFVIQEGPAGASDVLIVMAGTAGFAETPLRVLPASVGANNLRLANTLSLRGDDMVLLSDAATNTCMMTQVQAGFSGGAEQQLNLAGDYFAAQIGGQTLAAFGSSSSFAMPVGNADVARSNPPQFQLFGAGPNNTLVSYDLLQVGGVTTPVPLAEGVVELQALYGVRSGSDLTFIDPATAGFRAAQLMDGSATSLTNLQNIVAVRLAIVLRTSAPERTAEPGDETLTLFADLPEGVRQTRTFANPTPLRFRYRVIETTIPLRNNLLLAPPAPVGT